MIANLYATAGLILSCFALYGLGWFVVAVLKTLAKEVRADLVKFRDRMAGSEPNPSADYYTRKG